MVTDFRIPLALLVVYTLVLGSFLTTGWSYSGPVVHTPTLEWLADASDAVGLYAVESNSQPWSVGGRQGAARLLEALRGAVPDRLPITNFEPSVPRRLEPGERFMVFSAPGVITRCVALDASSPERAQRREIACNLDVIADGDAMIRIVRDRLATHPYNPRQPPEHVNRLDISPFSPAGRIMHAASVDIPDDLRAAVEGKSALYWHVRSSLQLHPELAVVAPLGAIIVTFAFFIQGWRVVTRNGSER